MSFTREDIKLLDLLARDCPRGVGPDIDSLIERIKALLPEGHLIPTVNASVPEALTAEQRKVLGYEED